MSKTSLRTELQSLQTIFDRSRAVEWPLDRVDGRNDVTELIHALESDALGLPEQNKIMDLLADVERHYIDALACFDEFKTVNAPPFFVDTYPAKVRRMARLHFWELVTTSRFAVEDTEQAREMIRRDFYATPPLRHLHITALACMVCLKNALETFEQLDEADDHETDALLTEAAEALHQAGFWAGHIETLHQAEREKFKAVEFTKANTERHFKTKRAEQATKAARKPRKPLTLEEVAAHFKANPDKPQKMLEIDLMESHGVSRRTVGNRLKAARDQKLMQ